MKKNYRNAERAKEIACNSNIKRYAVDLDDELDFQCKKCLSVVAPLHSTDFYMKITKKPAKLTDSYLVLRKMNYHRLVISEELSLI